MKEGYKIDGQDRLQFTFRRNVECVTQGSCQRATGTVLCAHPQAGFPGAPTPGECRMDGRRFDGMTRSLATEQTRRAVMRRLAKLAGALFIAMLPVRARAGFNCDYIGCGCATGTLHPCNDP